VVVTADGSNPDLSLEAARPPPPSADIGPEGQSVGLAAQFCLAAIEARSDQGRHLSSPKSASRLEGLTTAGVGIASTAIISLYWN